MAGTTRGPDPIGGGYHMTYGPERLDRLDEWAAQRGTSRAQAVRTLVDLGMYVSRTEHLDRPRTAVLARRRAELLRELAAIDLQLDDNAAAQRANSCLYVWHATDYYLLRHFSNQ